MSRKQPKRKGNPKKTKKPKSSSVVSADNRKLVWNVSKVDNDGQWGWDQVNCSYFFQEIWEKMHDFEKKKWSEILGRDHRKNHKIQARKIIGDAQKRLEELGHDDQEELVSFRLTGRQRLWAIQSGTEAFLLWWDPNHEICPSRLRNT